MPLRPHGILTAVSFFSIVNGPPLLTYLLGKVGWITQLVVCINQRQRYIATSLLQMLKNSPPFAGITVIGLVSSHPAACDALSKYTCTPLFSL